MAKLKLKADDIVDASDIHHPRTVEVRTVTAIGGDQHLLAFTSDWMADAFADWWKARGRASFLKYANNYAHEYL